LPSHQRGDKTPRKTQEGGEKALSRKHHFKTLATQNAKGKKKKNGTACIQGKKSGGVKDEEEPGGMDRGDSEEQIELHSGNRRGKKGGKGQKGLV